MIGSLVKRFWAKVEKSDSCWLWKGCLNNRGYGQFRGNGKTVLAHRVSWEIHNGPIPEELNVLHSCDNPRCINPGHLFLGTFKDNTIDMINKGRGSNGYRKGEKNPTHILNQDEVVEIIQTYRPRVISQQTLADMYGVSRETISAITTNRNWSHLGIERGRIL